MPSFLFEEDVNFLSKLMFPNSSWLYLLFKTDLNSSFWSNELAE